MVAVLFVAKISAVGRCCWPKVDAAAVGARPTVAAMTASRAMTGRRDMVLPSRLVPRRVSAGRHRSVTRYWPHAQRGDPGVAKGRRPDGGVDRAHGRTVLGPEGRRRLVRAQGPDRGRRGAAGRGPPGVPRGVG